jgi:glycosyltransferase involved in cell wall biosynthesis
MDNPSAIDPKVSVVIASHRPALLPGLLSALARQTAAPADFEIIAVCDYPAENLQAEHPGVFFHYVNNRSISAKRNAGVRSARAAAVAFIDDDCVPSTDWIEAGTGYLSAHPDAAAVEGFTTIENTPFSLPAVREYRRLEHPGFRTNNIFYRKQPLVDAGGFDERFTVQREDIDLAFSVLARGCLIMQSADIRVMHRLRKNEPWDLLKNCVNRRFDPLLLKKHPRRYREFIGSPFPRSLLMVLGFHALAAALLFAGMPFFIGGLLAGAAAITVLTLRRCGRGCSAASLLTEWISCWLAPPLLLGTLVYGSLRYRKFLVV